LFRLMCSLISLIVLMNFFLIRCILSWWHRIISILSLGVIIFFYWKPSIYILRSLVKSVFILWIWSWRTFSRKLLVALYLLMWILYRVCLFLWGYVCIWCIIIFIDIFFFWLIIINKILGLVKKSLMFLLILFKLIHRFFSNLSNFLFIFLINFLFYSFPIFLWGILIMLLLIIMRMNDRMMLRICLTDILINEIVDWRLLYSQFWTVLRLRFRSHLLILNLRFMRILIISIYGSFVLICFFWKYFKISRFNIFIHIILNIFLELILVMIWILFFQ
jgi:hypothetical protein